MTGTAAIVQIGKHGDRGFIILAGERHYVDMRRTTMASAAAAG